MAYQDCLLALDLGSTAEEQETVQRQLQIPAVLNLAACMLATKAFHRCKALCNVVLDLEPQSLKAIFRRALASFHLGELDEAKADLQRACAMCGGRHPCEAEEFSDAQDSVKDRLATKSHSLLSMNSHKELPSGIPENADDREKFLKKVSYYLHAIAQQQKRYAKACKNMFSDDRLESDGVSGTQDCKPGGTLHLERLPSQASWMSPLTFFKCSKCSFCARRAERVDG
ncbi:conserved hypothetical protein [Neospora caninum Liverpool]|uniref:70 kDa peptidyl-prolyl isomerase n=1 Tax=Neospora caninum (strain Liverpool) TaxID=572307 RepID=F0VR73_NEOCL|nr:conserved hypothetical protein [Neospora caninum Liverpool]CBZ56221.1 conserved hypothetical protein [Neospora caninum Liverpool]CEL70983.1 TPA: 70 kDa peptidyl-prolyl isomerase [Neospora caninum Liverpool]|eukprot:XP_003886246.1 conserved hypothetical protein [Neospora caninum Liverpool]